MGEPRRKLLCGRHLRLWRKSVEKILDISKLADKLLTVKGITVVFQTVPRGTMPMTPIERKAAFKSAVTLKETTLDAASNEACGVTWFHLSEGLANRRALSAEVQAKFAAYIGKSVRQVFGEQARSRAVA